MIVLIFYLGSALHRMAAQYWHLLAIMELLQCEDLRSCMISGGLENLSVAV